MEKAGILTILLMLGCTMFQTFATSNYLHIIPRSEGGDSAASIVKAVATGAGTVNERYNEQAEKLAGGGDIKKADIGKAFETGVINWDTLMAYVVYLMRFINQLGLLIGGIMILYAGYQYAGTIFKFGDATKGKNAIKNATIGILIIVFSYAIWKGLESMFL